MKRNILFILIFTFHSISSACSRHIEIETIPDGYDSIPVIKSVEPLLKEASGIADSKKNKGMLWVEEDSGNPPQLHLLTHEGKILKQVFIKNAINRDWEDICLADGKIYIGDIGDNAQVNDEYVIYIFDEPLSTIDTVFVFEKIRFRYVDGPRDAEAFFVDNLTKDIYIITKRDNPSKVYKLSYPYSDTLLNIAEQVAALTYTGVVSATVSPNGKEIILKTYIGLQQYIRGANQTIVDALKNKYVALPYKMEPQGEAVCFAANNTGYFTLSEKGFGSVVNLYFYRKK
ncbi:MAG: hypothetical protein ACKVOW_02195 [Chitinophagaceae bacterium]